MKDDMIIVEFEPNEIDTIDINEAESKVEHKEPIQVIDVALNEPVTVGIDEAFRALGEINDTMNHSLLLNRDADDQHPISSISGLKNKLDYIESLKTVYSNAKYQADYYEWEDDNPLQENRVGFFVSLGSNIKTIKICDGADVYGVTVDKAAFIGGQDDIARDCKYGLVIHAGVVNVRCESDVKKGDYVVSNVYGVAEKSENKYGCKVVNAIDIDGTLYATIALNIPIDQMDAMGKEFVEFDSRLDAAEYNITAAVNTANEALHKAGESATISEEALRDALAALDKAEKVERDTELDLDAMEQQIANAQKISVEAQAIANSAVNSAIELRDEAVANSNQALADVNDLIKDLEPISTWEDPGTGNIGAEYLTTYIKDGLATKADIQTVETKTEENKNAVLSNAEEFQRMISSVDKYSVGEYSQAYGLTKQQAKTILKKGMIYIPTKHSDTKLSHIEEYHDTELDVNEVNEFTPKFYYEWDGNDWIESPSNFVAFSYDTSYVPIPSTALKYWYIDSNEAPDGYEPYGLYIINEDNEWELVNTLGGNITNRVSSMIKQTANEVAMEVVNARGSYTSIGARINENEATVENIALWASGQEGGLESTYNLATIKQTADEAGATASMVAAQVLTPYITMEESFLTIMTTADTNQIYYSKADASYWFYQGGWKNTGDPEVAGIKINAASVVTAINSQTGETSVSLTGDHIILNGAITQIVNEDGDFTGNEGNFGVDIYGNMWATGGYIGNWSITEESIINEIKWKQDDNYKGYYQVAMHSPLIESCNEEDTIGTYKAFEVIRSERKTDGNYDSSPFYVTYDGSLHATKGDIAGWQISKQGLYKSFTGDDKKQYEVRLQARDDTDGTTKAIYTKTGDNYNFFVQYNGYLHAESGNIGGWNISVNKFSKENVSPDNLTKYETFIQNAYNYQNVTNGAPAFGIYKYSRPSTSSSWSLEDTIFYVTNKGYLHATSGNFSNDITIGGTTITAGSLRQMYNAAQGNTGDDTIQIKRIEANGGTIGAWKIGSKYLYSEFKESSLNRRVELDIDRVRIDWDKDGGGSYSNSSTWYQIILAGNASDARLKDNISYIDNKYENLFDLLIPKTFNYTLEAQKGNPNELHFGFIAQDIIEVQDKLDLNNLSLVYQDSYYGIKPQEITALNTWQIQKAKARITELENRVAELEKIIKGE